MAAARARGLGMPLGVSALLHAAVVGMLLVQRSGDVPPMPPTYKVDSWRRRRGRARRAW